MFLYPFRFLIYPEIFAQLREATIIYVEKRFDCMF